jgi:hypothetical protein
VYPSMYILPLNFIWRLTRSPCCLCVCVPTLIFLTRVVRSSVYVSPHNFFIFYAVRVISRRLMRSPCRLCDFVRFKIFSFSMRFVSYERKVGYSSQNFLFRFRNTRSSIAMTRCSGIRQWNLLHTRKVRLSLK